ncbi:hypothetical protein HMPREF9098_0188 [Kingella denitrificans ATCC 33394]|uniref:Uncharacterized protein n=1 Tax=Kingella denitrificans ATCC 33394 TaxID=888741 RepID=F0EWF4_9NEIS|nr:hypothetical protein HMPREF9098_0188 [Kingella denitrificans ATCC 33394]
MYALRLAALSHFYFNPLYLLAMWHHRKVQAALNIRQKQPALSIFLK